MTNCERWGFLHTACEQLSHSMQCPAIVLPCFKYLNVSFIDICLFLPCHLLSRPSLTPHPSNLRCLFGITVSCTLSGGGPIRKCACLCLTWRGHTPPSVQCLPSRPRKWLMRPSYECRVVARGIFKTMPIQALSKNKVNQLMTFCTSYGPFWEERATFSFCFLLLKHLM